MRSTIVLMDGNEIGGAQINVEESRSKFVRSITVEKARPRRLSRSAKFALEFVKLVKAKERKARLFKG